MSGFNQSALVFANAHLEEQKQAIMDTMPYINHIYLTDASTGDKQACDLFADYIIGIDGWATDYYANTYTISFKCRMSSADYTVDLRLEAIKLTDEASRKNNKAGFMFQGERYAFDGFCNINCQTIDGKGLYYGTISEEDWDRIREMENSGFELDCIFAIVIEINNPSMVYLSSDKSFINLQKMYGLKLKFCFVRDAEYGADKTKKEHQKKLVMTMPF